MERVRKLALIAILVAPGCRGEDVLPKETEKPLAPQVLRVQDQPGILRVPDGSFRFFRYEKDDVIVSGSMPEEVSALLEPLADIALPEKIPSQKLLLSLSGEIHAFLPKLRGDGSQIAVNRFIDLWHVRTRNLREEWEPPERFFAGYCGALMDYKQLSSGRIVVPFGSWIPNRPMSFPTGPHEVVIYYSDNEGGSWRESPSRLVAPVYEGYNGNNYGACEPTIVEVSDRTVWMLMRTQTGFLYESFSEDGVQWGEAAPSRFHASTGPPGVLRLGNDRIAMVWNNCEMPPRVEGAGVYGGRDEIHIAVSDDEGKTWRGFRTFYRDPFRNQSPPRSGDRGTAYPALSRTQNGNIVVLTGQGEGRRNIILVEADWITATHAEDDFSDGLGQWSVFKHFGPAEGWWRDREQGAQVVQHPANPGENVLHVRRPDEKSGDGAVWNFPLGRKGRLKLEVMLQEGFQGASIALNDRFFNPTDDRAETYAMFVLPVETDGRIGSTSLTAGQWNEITLDWDLSRKECRVLLKGEEIRVLKLLNTTLNGISYLRLRSQAQSIDPAGLLLNRVSVEVQDPIAPEASAAEKQAVSAKYADDFFGHRIKVIPRGEREAGFF